MSAPVTPSVYAPRCGHHGNPLTWLGDDHRWRCPDCFPELFPATPAAPGAASMRAATADDVLNEVETRLRDTPNVCPTCDDTGLVAPLGGRGSDGPDPCPHCTPAAGSPSPDTAALVAELRGPSGLASTSRAKHLTVGVCAVAADALEAQASRITELEQFLIRLGHNPDRLDLP